MPADDSSPTHTVAANPDLQPAAPDHQRQSTPNLLPQATRFTPISVPRPSAPIPQVFKSTPLPRRQREVISTVSKRELLPAPPRTSTSQLEPRQRTCFYDLPAELRIQIYRLVLENVTIHILPPDTPDRHCPHALVRTSHQVRREVLPMIHRECEVRATVTDFNFEGLLAWLSRIPPDQHANLTKNTDLRIRLCTTMKPLDQACSLRKWLHIRADPHRSQPDWQYGGPCPKTKVANDLKRRAKRMKNEPRKKAELMTMLQAIGVRINFS